MLHTYLSLELNIILLFTEQHSGQPTLASSEVFNMIATEDLARKTLSQIFIEKHNKLKAEKKSGDSENMFLATVEALETDGINLRQPPIKPTLEEDSIDESPISQKSPPRRKKLEFPSIDELGIGKEDKPEN